MQKMRLSLANEFSSVARSRRPFSSNSMRKTTGTQLEMTLS